MKNEKFFCTSCGKELPPESSFCPYCMKKFTQETVMPTLEAKPKKGTKKIIVAVVAVVVCAALAVGAVLVLPALLEKGEGGEPRTENVNADNDAETGKEPQTQEETDEPVKKSPENDNSIGLMNIKINPDDDGLTDTQRLLVEYFDTDYFRVPYSSLMRYQQAYKDTQVYFLCYVTKIIESSDSEYTALVEYEAYKIYEGEKLDSGNYAVIRGKQTDISFAQGDTLYLYGRFEGVNSYTVDSVSYTVPEIAVNRFTFMYYLDWVEPMYSMDEMRTLARCVFGDDVKLRYTTNQDVSDGVDYEFYEGLYYTAELDNQSNANFTKYLFHAGWGGYIYDCKTEWPVKRSITFSADFEHFYLQVFDNSLQVYMLECYDRNLNKIWSREFDQTKYALMDYTADYIYLVANGNLYILDSQSGEDAVQKQYVGEKIAIRKLEDGVLLLSSGDTDAVMKTDLTGNVLWTATLSGAMGEASMGNYVPVVQLSGGNYVIQYDTVKDGFFDGTYIAVITPDGEIKCDAAAF